MKDLGLPRRRAWWNAALLATAATAGSQTLDLAQALRIADGQGYGNRIAADRALSASGRNLSAWSGFVPSVRLEAGLSSTDAPLGAFADRIGQRRVSMASFDPSSLNDPDRIPNWSSAVVAEIPLVNLDALHGKRAARLQSDAAHGDALLERDRTRAQVVDAWFAVSLARAAVEAWDAGLAAARSYESQALSARRNESATPSDLLRARVEVASIRANLAKARTDVDLAQRKLALLLGGGPLPGSIPRVDLDDAQLAAFAKTVHAAGASLEEKSVELQARAAEANLSRTRAAFLPRLNGIARVDWQGRESPFEEDPSLTVGLMATWNVLDGLASVGSERVARGQWREARTGLEAIQARNALEREAAKARLASDLERLDIEHGALEQAMEAHRIVGRRFDEGLATIAERIEAGAAETRIRLELVSIRAEVVSSLAQLALLEGRDPAELASLAGAQETRENAR